jgi:hypothetical protein
MAWLAWDNNFLIPASPDYKVIEQEGDRQVSYDTPGSITYIQTTETVVSSISGLTLEGAKDGADVLTDLYPDNTVGWSRQNDANAYMVSWSIRSSTPWIAQTTTTTTTTTT